MHITIFGASGKVGRLVVQEALTRGYTVRAFVHQHNPFTEQERLVIVRGDISDISAVRQALQGSDAAISALGSWGTKSKNIVSTGMKTIMPAMQAEGMTRLVTLTGAGAAWSKDKPGALDKASHALMGLTAPKVLRDGEDHLRLLEMSNLAWTCVRAPVMRSDSSCAYELRLDLPSLVQTVSRNSVACCLVDLAASEDHVREAPVIYRAHH